MARTLLTAAAFALCTLAAGGCGRHADEPTAPSTAASTSTSTSEPAATAVAASDAPQDSPQDPPRDEAPRVRRAVREFIAEKYPNSEVEGVWTLALQGNYSFAGADTVINGRHRNIDVLVRHYVREDGSKYWRGEGFGPDTARMLRSNAISDAIPSATENNEE